MNVLLFKNKHCVVLLMMHDWLYLARERSKARFLCLSKYVVNMVYWNKSHGSRREWGFMFETLWKGFLDCVTAGSQVVSFTPSSNHLSIWSFFEMMMLIFTFRNGSVVILAVTKTCLS